MKVEIPAKRPEHYEEFWPGLWELFNHYEFVAGVPSPIFLITTLKENGKANACMHSWSSFVSDSPEKFYAVMPGLMQTTHTYKNILRDGEFCVNFLPLSLHSAMEKTIAENGDGVDELAAAGLHAEPAKLVKPPRVAEAFISYECKLQGCQDISGNGISAMITGEVVHAVAEDSLRDEEKLCSPQTFVYNIHSPINPTIGKRTSMLDGTAYLQLNKG